MTWQWTTLICVVVVCLLADHAIVNICKTFGVKR